VLANMAVDSWIPRQFRNLSGRLVTQNGIFLMGQAKEIYEKMISVKNSMLNKNTLGSLSIKKKTTKK